MELINKKIFITGGAGFIGSNLVNRLIKNNKITIYDNLSSGKKEFLSKHLKNANLKLVMADALNFQKMKQVMEDHDVVFHLASNPNIAKAVLQPELDLKQGILTTFNVLEAMRLTGVKKLFYPSGSGVYGDQGVKYTAESFGPLLPVSMYGASKLSAEGLISAFCHLYGLKAWIFRPANIVGPNQTHGVGYDFINKLKKNPTELVILGDGRQSKSYIHVSDFISAIFRALEKTDERINLFNIASNGFTDVKTIAKIVVDEMELKNVKLKYTGGSIGWKGDIPKVRLDTKKIREIGWKPLLISDRAVRRSVKELLKKPC